LGTNTFFPPPSPPPNPPLLGFLLFPIEKILGGCFNCYTGPFPPPHTPKTAPTPPHPPFVFQRTPNGGVFFVFSRTVSLALSLCLVWGLGCGGGQKIFFLFWGPGFFRFYKNQQGFFLTVVFFFFLQKTQNFTPPPLGGLTQTPLAGGAGWEGIHRQFVFN